MRLLLSLVSLAAAGAHISDERLLRQLLSRSSAAEARLRSLQPRPPPGGGGGGGGPGGGMTPGAAASTACGSALCTTDGGGNYMSRSLALNATTGLFTGSLTTNACPNHAGAYEYGGVKDLKVSAATATCQKWTLPVAGYTAFPVAAPLRASIGYTISGGEAIYGPMDAGFTVGQVCTTAYGTCPAGTDTRFCGALIEKACGTANLKGNTTATMHMLLSDCGGHAGYHNHEGLACENSGAQAAAAVAGHSPLLAVQLDGRGLYGQHEQGGAPPGDLDACNGHFGATPATAVGADAYPATAHTYHYHLTPSAPFTAGCFGPVASAAQARGLYSSCAAGGAPCACSQGATCSCSAGQVMSSVCTSLGSVASYTLDCPIYGARGGLTAPAYIDAGDPRCPPCAGNCPAQGATTVAPGSAAPSPTPSPSSTPPPTPSPTPTPLEPPSASQPPKAPAASSPPPPPPPPPPQSPSPSPTSPSSSPSPPPTPAAATPAAPPATASAALVLQGPLPASAFSNGTLAPAALASLTRSLALAAAAAGCSSCAARITRAVETATGVVVFDGSAAAAAAVAAAAAAAAAAAPAAALRRALAGIGALTVTYTVTGPAAGVAAATTAPSPAFSAVLASAVYEAYGVAAGVAAAPAAAQAAAPAAAAAGGLSEAAKGAIGGAVGGCALLLGLLAAAVHRCRQGGKARAGSAVVTSSQA